MMELYKLDMLVMAETRADLEELLPGRGRAFHVRGKSQYNSGVAIVYPVGECVEIQAMSERVIHLKLKEQIQLIGAYGVTDTSSSAQEKATLWEYLTQLISKQPTIPCILLGDLNAGHEPVKNFHKSKTTNYQHLQKLIRTTDAQLLDHGPTWVPKFNVAKDLTHPIRTLDRIIVRWSEDFSAEVEVNLELRPVDHAIVIARICFPSLDRNIGRPKENKALDEMDGFWLEMKRKIRQLEVKPTESFSTLGDFWKARRRITREERECLKICREDGKVADNEDGAALVRQYLETLWGGDTKEAHDALQFDDSNYVSPSPSQEEIERVISMLQKEAAPGKDRICPLTVKENKHITAMYCSLLSFVWLEERIPKEWKDVIVRPIVKKVNPARANEIRPITLVSTSMKIVNGVIGRRYAKEYEGGLHPNQHAYRSGRSTVTAVEQLIRGSGKVNGGM